MEFKNIIGNRVFLKDFEEIARPDEKIIRVEYNESIKIATVHQVGEDVNAGREESAKILPGTKVIIQLPCGITLDYEGEKYQIVQRNDILLVI
mgnify:CR=1 FL=1